MKWQEYQDAVGELYAHMDEIGEVKKNIFLPDKITGQLRQIDVWWEIKGKGHGILIDAKMRKEPLDVKDIEEVLALTNAVGANKAIIVTVNGWTEPAEKKAKYCGMDLRILKLEDALKIIVMDMWKMCPSCDTDCIVMDSDGFIEYEGLFFWWIAGRCRECNAAIVWCQDCGFKELVLPEKSVKCWCGHLWENDSEVIWLQFKDSDVHIPIPSHYNN